MDTVSSIVAKVNSFLWDYLLIILLCGSGIYFTIRFKFVQIFKFKDGWDRTFGSLSLMGKSAGKEGMSSFQSLATAIAAQVGTGNLAGAATALISGGPGAIFWMWVSAFLGMATIFVEASLGQKYKTTTVAHNTIGMVIVTTSVERMSRKKSRITSDTKIRASTKVFPTSSAIG